MCYPNFFVLFFLKFVVTKNLKTIPHITIILHTTTHLESQHLKKKFFVCLFFNFFCKVFFIVFIFCVKIFYTRKYLVNFSPFSTYQYIIITLCIKTLMYIGKPCFHDFSLQNYFGREKINKACLYRLMLQYIV